MKASATKTGKVKIVLSNEENAKLNGILDKYIAKASSFPNSYPLVDFARKLRGLEIKPYRDAT